MSNSTQTVIVTDSAQPLILGAVAVGLGGCSFLFIALKALATKYVRNKINTISATFLKLKKTKGIDVGTQVEADIEKQASVLIVPPDLVTLPESPIHTVVQEVKQIPL